VIGTTEVPVETWPPGKVVVKVVVELVTPPFPPLPPLPPLPPWPPVPPVPPLPPLPPLPPVVVDDVLLVVLWPPVTEPDPEVDWLDEAVELDEDDEPEREELVEDALVEEELDEEELVPGSLDELLEDDIEKVEVEHELLLLLLRDLHP
jgi:hypothetical protein